MNRIIGNSAMPDGGRLLQVAYDEAGKVRPGHWFQLALAGLKLSLPVLDASPAEGWLAFHVPPSTTEASIKSFPYGTPCSLEGPQGTIIGAAPAGRRLVLLADTAGLPVVLFAARLAAVDELALNLALVEITGGTPPVRLRPSRFMLAGMPPGTIAGLGPLEDAGIPSRIASPEGSPGCYDGDLASLVAHWLSGRDAKDRWQDATTVIGNDHFANTMAALLKGRIGQYDTCPVPG